MCFRTKLALIYTPTLSVCSEFVVVVQALSCLFAAYVTPSVQFSRSVMSNSLQPHKLQHASFPVLHHLPELAQTHVHQVSMLSNHLVLCHPFLLLPSVFPSSRVFSNELALLIRWPKYWSFTVSICFSNEVALLIRWPKYWDFSFSISPSNEYSRLISF